MTHRLVHDRYGKQRIHLTWLDREREPHTLRQLVLGIALEGDFAASYTAGDNTRVIATDSMKNTAYVQAREQGVASLEGFAARLAAHLVDAYGQVERATVDAEELPWRPIATGGAAHPRAFVAGGDVQTARAIAERGARPEVRSGLRDLRVLKSGDSGFSDFVDDRYRTLPDTADRLFATAITAGWARAADRPGDDRSWSADRQAVRVALLDVFASHRSLSVQHTLHAMAAAALDAAPAVAEVTLVLPNQHHLLVDLSPFGLDNPNRVFVATEEPYGCIEGTVRRGA
ncbi:MAG TPA: urate oxidase [Thermoanaerobaculia bacterium]|nr:urate oxidase [Thermoanaerobaculia bacterium]